MTKRVLITLLQILVISTILFSSYFFFYLKPKRQLANNIIQAEKILTIHKNTLTQNRIAYVGLTQLDPSSPIFTSEASNLIATLEKTQKDGLEQTGSKTTIPKTNIISYEVLTDILKKTEDVYKVQEDILKELKSTKSYKDGLVVLKSQKSVNALSVQTNLILEYEYWISKLSQG